MSISIHQIKYVLQLEKSGNFSEAAEACYITQSTLSIMIKKLESQLGMQLFDRDVKPIKLTQEGEKIIEQFKIINNDYENLLEIVEQTKGEYHSTFKIGIIPTLAPFLLPLILHNLVNNHPHLKLNVHEITTHEILHLLKLKELDVGILSLPIENPNFIQTSLFKEEFLIYDAREQHKFKKKYKVKDIDISRLLILEESHCITSQIEKICILKKKQEMSGSLVFKTGSILSLVELVNINKGITLLPKLSTIKNNLINQEWLYPIESPTPVRDIGLITHKNFTKRKLFIILKEEIMRSVKPFMTKKRKVDVIKPF